MKSLSSEWLLFLLFIILLIVFFTSGCATKPEPKPLELNWAFCEVVPMDEPWACLREKDVQKLREALIRCQSQSQSAK